jgi:hypothetical protein
VGAKRFLKKGVNYYYFIKNYMTTIITE